MTVAGTSVSTSHCMMSKFKFSLAYCCVVLVAIVNGVVPDGTAAGALTGCGAGMQNDVEQVLLHVVVKKSAGLSCFIYVTCTSARFCVVKQVYPTL